MTAVIWKGDRNLLTKFQLATGKPLGSKMKLLLYVQATFHETHGFKLRILDIDPTYTLADLEARKTAIREKLQRGGLWERNRQLPSPEDFFHIAVIASRTSAGIGDFRVIADKLVSPNEADSKERKDKVLRFHYYENYGIEEIPKYLTANQNLAFGPVGFLCFEEGYDENPHENLILRNFGMYRRPNYRGLQRR